MLDYLRTFTGTVINYLAQGVAFIDSNKNIIYWNRGAESILGYPLSETARHTCCQITAHFNLNGEKLCGEHCPITKTLQEGRPQEADMFIAHKDGQLVYATVRTFPVHDKAGQVAGVIELFSDNARINIGHEKVKALTKAAYMDSLSELFSKQYIETRLQTMFKEIPARREVFGILYINIVGFRVINEAYGVSGADKILKMVAKSLSAQIAYPAIIGRWHGASFIVIVDTDKKSLLLMLADKLKTLVAESALPLNGETIHVTVSIGCAISQPLDSIDYIIERATKDSLEDHSDKAPPVPSPIANAAPVIAKQRNRSGFYSNSARAE